MLSALVGKADNMQGQMASVIQKTANLTENKTLEMENTTTEMKDASESLSKQDVTKEGAGKLGECLIKKLSKLKEKDEELGESRTQQKLKTKTASKYIGMLIT